MIIAIDGPAASGKGTLAKRIADHYGYPCLDTGLIYRAVARDCLAAGDDLEDEAAAAKAARNLAFATLDDIGLKLPGVGDKASIVAKFPSVRAALLQFQRDFAATPPGAVLDGRDIGTVVCPNADVKLFVTADIEVRARRRFSELSTKGEDVTYERVLDVIRGRDARDAGRADAPMKMAADALLLDTSNLDIDSAFDAAIGLIKRTVGQ
ncbi:MAG: (d)CMP kinase [Hyphomicrobiaceae bacterium]